MSLARAAAARFSTPRAPAPDPVLLALADRFPGAPDHWLRMIAARAPHLARPESVPDARQDRTPSPPVPRAVTRPDLTGAPTGRVDRSVVTQARGSERPRNGQPLDLPLPSRGPRPRSNLVIIAHEPKDAPVFRGTPPEPERRNRPALTLLPLSRSAGPQQAPSPPPTAAGPKPAHERNPPPPVVEPRSWSPPIRRETPFDPSLRPTGPGTPAGWERSEGPEFRAPRPRAWRQPGVEAAASRCRPSLPPALAVEGLATPPARPVDDAAATARQPPEIRGSGPMDVPPAWPLLPLGGLEEAPVPALGIDRLRREQEAGLWSG